MCAWRWNWCAGAAWPRASLGIVATPASRALSGQRRCQLPGAAVHPNMVCVEFVLTSSLLAGARARLECLKHVLPALVACVW